VRPFRRAAPDPERQLRDRLDAAYRAFDAERWDEAAPELARAVEAARVVGVAREDLATWVFDLALIHKFRRDWPAAVTTGLQAADLAPADQGEPAWWNLGIAATAVHDWATARRAWTKYGVDIPSGDGPIDGDFGPTPVRIETVDGAEVVWCRRIDPARAVIESIPLPGSGRRWGETVLHDGVPHGERVVGGRTYSVFDELEVWAPSEVPVQAVQLRVAADADVGALSQLAAESGLAAESWETVQVLCAACSEGRVDSDASHEHAPSESVPGRCRVGIAATAGDADRLLQRWIQAAPARRGAGTLETVA
jgi:hypothetical protein